jgi:ATP-dependent RNA helicase DDX3X
VPCAHSATQPLRRQPRPTKQAISQHDLFEKQGTAGINFKQYEELDVQRSGPASDTPPLLSFDSLADQLPPFLLANIKLMRYTAPTPIQSHAVPLGIANRDLMCCAQTGSGKTAAFLIPCIAALARNNHNSIVPNLGTAPAAIVLSPTRELTSQIHLEALKLCNGSAMRAVVVYGGASSREQLAQLAAGCDICVATPGRLSDFCERGVVSLSKVAVRAV